MIRLFARSDHALSSEALNLEIVVPFHDKNTSAATGLADASAIKTDPQSCADHRFPQHAEEAARLNRYPKPAPGPQMKPVEGVHQVFGAFRSADRDPSSFRLCDMPPY